MVVAAETPAIKVAVLFRFKGKRVSYGDLRNRERYKDENKSLVGIHQFVNKLIKHI